MTIEIMPSHPVDADIDELADFVASTLSREGVDEGATLTIAFVSPDAMADLNSEHMGKSGPTDVLSFPIEDAAPGHPPVRSPNGPPLALGDIIVCPEVVARNAEAYGVAFDDELHLMICHGVLHILGWDHQTDAQAHAMEQRESEHLATIGRVRR